jgi:DNA polymerase-3 subunit alpha
VKFPDIPEFDMRTKLSFEKEYLGMYVSGHLTDDYSDHVAVINPDKIISLSVKEDEEDEGGGDEKTAAPEEGSTVTVCGILSKITVKYDKEDREMAFVTVEDDTGEIECIAFSKVYLRFAMLLSAENAVAVKGKLSSRGDSAKIIISGVVPLMTNSEYREELERKKAASAAAQRQETKNGISRIYVRLDCVDCPTAERIRVIAELCPGPIELYIYSKADNTYNRLSIGVSASEFVRGLIRSAVPEGDYAER